MKKLILIIVVLSVSVSCKKKENANPSEVYCVRVTNGDGTTTSYGCFDTKKAAQDKTVQLNSQGMSAQSFKKSTCAECN